jgi:SSS family solute:Na+ symporter
MHLIDWILVGGCLGIVLFLGIYTQRYVKSVADFLSAGRVARRYLLAVATGEMGSGAIIYVAGFEVIKNSGFSTWWWAYVTGPIGLLVSIFGFIVYRFRETRAMTLGQFFEIRYSRKFRLFTGGLAFFAGILNFGIGPAIGAQFLVYMLGLPPQLDILGLALPTFIPLMALLLSITLGVTLAGGLITIIMTNCVEGILTQILNLVLIFGLLGMFTWTQISGVLVQHPHGESYINPFDSFHLQHFNVWFVFMNLALAIYGTQAWQNQSAYKSAPLTAHEGRMGSVLSQVRRLGMGATGLLCICAMTYLGNPDFAAGAAQVHADLARVADPQMRGQLEIPIALTHLLPAGLKGAFCVILLLGTIGGDCNHLHSWGSIFIQDIVLPLRKQPFAPAHHLRLLRWSIAGVALFAFAFGSLFHQIDYIMMWWAITSSIFVGGAGVAIIGGLYWKKGTTPAAWAGLINGSALALGGVIAKEVRHHGLGHSVSGFYTDHFGAIPSLLGSLGAGMTSSFLYITSFDGMQIAFTAMVMAVVVYVVVSLLTCGEDFNMDRMLHRGQYANIAVEIGEFIAAPAPKARKVTWGKLIGYDEHFSRGDKWIAGGLFAWSMMFVCFEIFGSIAYLIHPWSDNGWLAYWHIFVVVVPVLFAVAISVWFTWGGIRDALYLFRRLETERSNPLDDGLVQNHQNLDETILPDAASPLPIEAKEPAAIKSR